MNGNSDIKSFLVVEKLRDETGFQNYFLVNKILKRDGKNRGGEYAGVCVLKSAEEKLLPEQRQEPFNPNLYKPEEIFFLKTVNSSKEVEFFTECLAGDVLRSMLDKEIIPSDRQEHFSLAKPVTLPPKNDNTRGGYALLQPFACGYKELYKLQNPDQKEKTNFSEVYDRVFHKQGYEYVLKHGRPVGLSYILMLMVGTLHNNSVHSGNIMVKIEAYLLVISGDEEIPQDFELGLIFQDGKLFYYDNKKNPSKLPFQVAPEKEDELQSLLTDILQKNEGSDKKIRLSDTNFSNIISCEEKKDASNERDPYKIALIHFKIIDYGAAFRYPGSLKFFLAKYTDGNPMPSLEEVHQSINTHKKYMGNYKNMSNLFPTVINHAKIFLKNTKKNREQLNTIYQSSVTRQLGVYKKYINDEHEWPQKRAELIAYMYGSHSYNARNKLIKEVNAIDNTTDADARVVTKIGEMLYDAAIERLRAMRQWKPTHGWEAKRGHGKLYDSGYKSISSQDGTSKADDASTVTAEVKYPNDNTTVSSTSASQDAFSITPVKSLKSAEEFNDDDSRYLTGDLWKMVGTLDDEKSPRKRMMLAAPTLKVIIANFLQGLKNDDDVDINNHDALFNVGQDRSFGIHKGLIEEQWIPKLSIAFDQIESLAALHEILKNEPKKDEDKTAFDVYIAGAKEKLKNAKAGKDFNALVEICEKELNRAKRASVISEISEISNRSTMSDLTMSPSLKQPTLDDYKLNTPKSQWLNHRATMFYHRNVSNTPSSSIDYLSSMYVGMTPEKGSGDDSDHSDTEEEGTINNSKKLFASP